MNCLNNLLWKAELCTFLSKGHVAGNSGVNAEID